MKHKNFKTYGILLAAALMAGSLIACGNKEALENQAAYRQIGINDMQEGKYEDAVDAFQKALGQSVSSIGERELDICYYKAQAQYLAGDTKGALETYTALIDYDKKNADAYYLRGSLYLLEDEDEKAVKDYENAVKYDDQNYDLYIQAYCDLKDAGLSKEAEPYLEKAVALKGKDARDYTMRGKVYVLMGDYEKATEQLDQAIELGSQQAVLYRAQVYSAKGDAKKAKSLYESYVKENKDNAAALGSLGNIFLEQGDYAEALKYIQMALSIDGKKEEQSLRKNEILAYEYQGDFASAKSKMESYVSDYPDDADAVREYQFLQTR